MFLFVCLFVFIILLEEYASLSDSKCIAYFETDTKKKLETELQRYYNILSISGFQNKTEEIYLFHQHKLACAPLFHDMNLPFPALH